MSVIKLISYIIVLFGLFSCRPSSLNILNEAAALEKEGKLTDAIQLCGEVIDRDSTNELAHYNRGIYYVKGKDYKKAVADFTKVIELQPHEGAVFLWNTDSPLADDNIKMKVSFLDALYQRAQAYYYMGERRAAYRDFQELIDWDYKLRNRCLLYQGLIHIASAEKDKACELFDTALKNSFGAYTDAVTMKNTYCK